MKKILLLALVLFVAGFGLLKFQSLIGKYQTIHVAGQTLRVEVARTGQELSKGLGERNAIGSDGMLFVLPGRDVARFWMQGMRFDLDFVWIDGNKIISLTPRISAGSKEIYSSSGAVTHVLELPSGDIAKRGIKIGDEIRF